MHIRRKLNVRLECYSSRSAARFGKQPLGDRLTRELHSETATGTYGRSPRNALASVPAQPQATTWIRRLLDRSWLADASNPPTPWCSFCRVDAGHCRLCPTTALHSPGANDIIVADATSRSASAAKGQRAWYMMPPCLREQYIALSPSSSAHSLPD
ncbi:hypothetical protein IG631_23409 [Alternaria alternata]|nr:hypothetical protein IG631_23409 [Alternaria alternata]